MDNLSPKQEENIKYTPLFLYHGMKDKMLSVNLVKETYHIFEKIYSKNKNALSVTYDSKMDHNINHDLLHKLMDWLENIFKKPVPFLPKL